MSSILSVALLLGVVCCSPVNGPVDSQGVPDTVPLNQGLLYPPYTFVAPEADFVPSLKYVFLRDVSILIPISQIYYTGGI